ncbi:MAG: hypothetical protein JK586_14565 [Nocardiopsis sp. BM-2018]|nr:MAG: hypothetical protein JK586_14565 [Nocardiopsis sp. BM-2018]
MTTDRWHDAEFYASMLGVGKQQVDRLPSVGGRAVDIQLVLGGDARVFDALPAAIAVAAAVEMPTTLGP